MGCGKSGANIVKRFIFKGGRITMNRFSRLVIVCAWHKPYPIILGLSDPTPPGQTGLTHGICPQCQHQYFTQKEQP
jgi:hypothetical protein